MPPVLALSVTLRGLDVRFVVDVVSSEAYFLRPDLSYTRFFLFLVFFLLPLLNILFNKDLFFFFLSFAGGPCSVGSSSPLSNARKLICLSRLASAGTSKCRSTGLVFLVTFFFIKNSGQEYCQTIGLSVLFSLFNPIQPFYVCLPSGKQEGQYNFFQQIEGCDNDR